MTLYFTFYRFTLELEVRDSELRRRLALDFEYFLSPHLASAAADFRLVANCAPPSPIPSDLVAAQQTDQFILYRHQGLRYIDYHGAATAIHWESQHRAEISCPELDRLHELIYLFILSVSSKALDLLGLHKVHSFGVMKNGVAIIGMMPMKGGKTTTFINLLKDPEVQILSDDCPLIDRRGTVLPFPLRVGVESAAALPPGKSELLYSINRRQYGPKTLAPLSYFNNSVATNSPTRVILLNGVRSSYAQPKISRQSCLFGFIALLTHMVAGIGLPMIIEHFLRFNWRDYPFLIGLALSRSWAAIQLLRRSEFYQVILSKDPTLNSQAIKDQFWK